jgi:alpha/beta superfamily hydrolase
MCADLLEAAMSTRSIRTTFAGSLGHELAARLDLPSASVRAHALFAHCFTCTKDIVAARHIAAKLASLGIAVLRFDFTGLGSSEGEFENTNFSSNVEDLVLAANHLRTHYRAPAVLIGHSLGGAAVLAAAHRIPEAKAVVTLGAPSDVAHVLHHFRTGKIDRFERVIGVEGGVEAALVDKLIEIAARCPVHRTLEAGSAIVTKVSDNQPPV